MANKETRIYKTDTLETLRQKSNEISLHLGDNEQLNALMADKTYIYSASAGDTLFAGSDTSTPAKTARFEVSPAHTVDNTGGYIILEGVSSLDSSFIADAIIYQGSTGSKTWQATIVSATTGKILVRDSSGTFTTSSDLKVDTGVSSFDSLAHAKVIRIVTEAYPVGIVRVYKNNTELTQDISANGFHVANIRATITQTGSPTLTNYTEGVTIYQGDSQSTQAGVEANATWYGTLHSVSGGVIRVKTYNGSFNAGTLIRALGSTDTITGANHGALVPVDSSYGSYIELNTPAAGSDQIKVFSLDLVAAINELQDDIGTVESLTTAANDLVLAINEHDAELGTITSGAMGTSASTVSTAIREHEDQIGNVNINTIASGNNTITGALDQIHAEIGDVTQGNLGTAASNLTSAVREHEDQIGNENITSIDAGSNTITGALNQLHTEVGSLSLNTSATDLTAAINEHEGDIGNMSLTGLTATDLSAAIRELRVELGNHLEIDDATGYSATTAVGGIKEIQGDIGDVDDLDTNTTADLVAAINELENVLRDDTTTRTGYVMGTNANNVITAINEIENVLRGANSNYTLNTAAQNVRDAINEHESQIGNMVFGTGGPVDAANSTDLSGAVRVLDAEIGDTSYTGADLTTAIHDIQDDINVNGSLTSLHTTNTSIVDAINEIEADLFNSGNAGSGGSRREMSDLKTADKTSILDAINEIYDDIHTAGSVTLDTQANYLVGAINEIEGVFDASTKEISAGSDQFDITSGNFVLDSSGVISLDSSTGTLNLRTDGSEFGQIVKLSGSNNIVIKSGTTTMLTGSGANATFANNLTITNDLIVSNNVDIEGNVDVNGSIETDGLSINGTTVTATATELNVMDGGTSATSTTIADADRVVVNDNGIMKQVAVTDLTAYFDHEITNMPNLIQSGALNSGSITSGFGSINVGTSAITGGIITGTSFVIGSANISEAELERIDGTNDNGVVTALKAVVVDTNKDVTGFRNITLSGELDAGSLDISGNVDTDGTLDVALGSTLRGAVSITDNTASSSTTTGALTVVGGVGIGEDLYVAGDLYVEGTRTELNVTTLEVEDTLILAGNNLSSEPTSGGFGIEVGPIPSTAPTGVASNVTGAHSIVYNYATDRWEADGSLILSSATLDTPYIEGVSFGPSDDLTFSAGSGLSETVVKTGATIVTTYTNTDKGSSQNIFKNVVAGGVTVVADSNNDTLTFTDDNVVNALATENTDTIALSHADVFTGTAGSFGQTSTQDGQYIKSLTLTAEGHVSAITTADFDTRYQATNPYWVVQADSTEVDQVGNTDIVNFTSGSGIVVSGSKTTSNNIDTSSISIAHADTSSVTNLAHDGSNGVVLQDISLTFDTYGHVTGRSIGTVDLDNRYMQHFTLHDGDGTQRTIERQKEVKFIEGTGSGATINIDWTDISTGSDADPYDLTFSVTNTDKGSAQNIFKHFRALNHDGTVIGTSSADSNSDTFDIKEVQVSGTDGITLSQLSGDGIGIAHADTSSYNSIPSISTGSATGTVITGFDVNVDTYGHVTGVSGTQYNLDGRYEKLADIPSYSARSYNIACSDSSPVEVVDNISFSSNTLGHVTGAAATKRSVSLSDFGWSAWAISDGTNSETVGGTGQTITFNDDGFLTQSYNTTNNQMTVGHPTSPLSGNYGNTGGENGVYIKSITVDTRGHLTAVTTDDFDDRYDFYDEWRVQADTDTSNSNYGHVDKLEYVKFVGGNKVNTTRSGNNITINLDTNHGFLTSQRTATLDVQGNSNNPYIRLNDGGSSLVQIKEHTASDNIAEVTGSESADAITIYVPNPNTDINVNKANLEARLAEVDGTVYIGNTSSTNNIIVRGNFEIQGTQTTVNQETVKISDNELILNSDVAGNPTQDAFISVERGSSTNAQLKWSESANRWYQSFGESAGLKTIPVDVEDGANLTRFYIQGDPDTGGGTGTITKDNTLLISGTAPISTQRSGDSIIVKHDQETFKDGVGVSSNAQSVASGSTLTYGGTFSVVTATAVTAHGHVDEVTTKTFTMPAGAVPNNGTLTMGTSAGLDGSATFTADQAGPSTFTVSLDLSELTDMTADVSGANDELILLDSGAERRKRIGEIKLGQFDNDQGWTDNIGDITRVNITAGNGLTGNKDTTAGDHNQTIHVGAGALIDVQADQVDVDLTELTDMGDGTAVVGTEDYMVLLDNGTAQRKKKISTITLSDFYNDLGNYGGWTTNAGDITRVNITAGAGLSGSVDTAAGDHTQTLAVDLSELTDMTADVVGTQDELILLDNGADRRKLISEIKLSQFNNDAGFITTDIKLNDVTTIDNGAHMILRHVMSDGTTSHDIGITAGSNITLTPGTKTFEIEATNTTYSAGTALSLSGTTFNLRADQKAYFNNGLTVKVGNVHEYMSFDPALEGGGIRLYADQSEVLQIYKDTANSVMYFPHSSGPAMGITTGESTGSNSLRFFTESNSTLQAKMILSHAGALQVHDDITAFSSSTASDVKLKENIEKVEGALDKVSQLDGVTFTWKRDGKESAGVIAQNVEEVLPSAVKEVKALDSEEINKHVDYTQLSALFIEAIKELKEENKLLRAEIENLKDINS